MSTIALDGALPRSRAKDPVTSVDAGREAALMESQREVLQLLRNLGCQVSDRELVRHALRVKSVYSPQRLRSARAELAEIGLVVLVDGVYRTSPRGRREQVWELVA